MAAVQGEAAGVKEKRPRDPDKGSAVPEPEERDSADSEVSVLTVKRVAAKKKKKKGPALVLLSVSYHGGTLRRVPKLLIKITTS